MKWYGILNCLHILMLKSSYKSLTDIDTEQDRSLFIGIFKQKEEDRS